MDHPSRESDVIDEELDELEVDLDTPWVKPSVEQAKKAGKVGSKPSAPQNCRNGYLPVLLVDGVPPGSNLTTYDSRDES